MAYMYEDNGDPTTGPTVPGGGNTGIFNGNTGMGGFQQGSSQAPYSQGGGGGGGGGGSAAPVDDLNALKYAKDPSDFSVGLDGTIYQAIRQGYRIVDYRPVGNVSDINAAAATAGVPASLIDSSIRRQQTSNATTAWQMGMSASGGTNQDLELQNRGGQNEQDKAKLAWMNAMSQGNGSMSNADFERQLQGGKDQLSGKDTTYDLANWDRDHALKDSQSKLQGEETDYNLANFQGDKALRDMQRSYQTSDTGWKLAHMGQQQAADAQKLNQTTYEQGRAAQSVGTVGYGYGAMLKPAQAVAGR